MSLQEKSSQTISEEILKLKGKVALNGLRLDVFHTMIEEIEELNTEYREAIKEMENQLQLRAKLKR